MIRDHLIPLQKTGSYRARWGRFWEMLALDPRLYHQATDILNTFMDQASAALEAGDLDPAQTKRADLFFDRADSSLRRIEEGHKAPLAWLGPRAADYNDAARVVIDKLVHTIADHRDNTATDDELWAVLAEIKMDPRRPAR